MSRSLQECLNKIKELSEGIGDNRYISLLNEFVNDVKHGNVSPFDGVCRLADLYSANGMDFDQVTQVRILDYWAKALNLLAKDCEKGAEVNLNEM